MTLLTRLRASMRPPYGLRTAIMFGATVSVVVLGVAFALVANYRMARITLAAAESWSISVAQLASSANTSALILNDIAVVESNLQQVAKLPGVDRVTIFRADGREIVHARKHDGVVISEVGGKQRMVPNMDGAQSIEGTLHDGYYEAWAPISSGRAFPRAWVQVHFSLEQRNVDLQKLWLGAGALIIVCLGIMLTCLNWVTKRALKPIRKLSHFAAAIPQNIGSQTMVTHDYIEVEQLGSALNQASREIAAQVERTRSIVNTASDAIIGLDEHAVISTLNPAALSFFGRLEHVLIGSTIGSCIPGLTIKAMEEMFVDPTTYYYGMDRILRRDLFGVRVDGTLFPVEISLGQVANIAGLRYVCFIRDVTDERAAMEFTELYERALSCSHNAVFITNAKLSHQPLVYVNDAMQAMLAQPLHEIFGSDILTLLKPDKHSSALVEMRSALAEQRHVNVTLNLADLGGKPRIVELSLSPVHSDKGVLTHTVGIVLDVTKRVRAEEANEKRRAQLDAVFSLSPDGFVLFDANDQLVFANPAFESMMGPLPLDPNAPMSLDAFETFLRSGCDPLQELASFEFNKNVGRDAQGWQARMQLVRPQVRVVQAQARRNGTERSETIFYFRDVTHEDAVDRMKSEFLAAAAHELRTPMVSIFGFTELLLKRQFTPERRTDMLDTIHRQSGLLVKMINELLDLARIESRRGLDLHIAPAPLPELVHNAVKGLMLKDTDRQVRIGEIPNALVLIDTEKMQLAMNNLLSNALKYSPQGGDVRVAAHFDTLNGKAYAAIEVSDQGIGMSPDQLARAFERFYRADASGNIPGTGLGLSMVKEVAALHSGHIELYSTLGSGTTARLWIPLAAPQLGQRG